MVLLLPGVLAGRSTLCAANSNGSPASVGPKLATEHGL